MGRLFNSCSSADFNHRELSPRVTSRIPLDFCHRNSVMFSIQELQMTHLFNSRSTEDLMATLSIWDTTHHKVIHGMVWQVEPDRFKLDDPQSVIGKF